MTSKPDGESTVATMVFKTISTVFTELVEGTSDAAWALNPGDEGLLKSLGRLSSAEASVPQQGGGASIAAHVDHLCYGLSLMNRWAAGEQDPFTSANFRSSWERGTVSDAEWKALRERLRNETRRWQDALSKPRAANEFELTGIVASAAHLAYHLGAIRQINRTTRGPSANG